MRGVTFHAPTPGVAALALVLMTLVPAGGTALAADGTVASTATAAAPRLQRSLAHYVVPSVNMIREDGKAVRLQDEFADQRPIVLNFIYTSCNGICPMLSQTLSMLQRSLGKDRDAVRIISVSIDPEQDTPARLTEYANQFHAGPEWHHYTGTTQASLQVQRAFNVYRGDKMSHTPVTLMRPAPGKDWVRFDGYASAEDLLRELPQPIASR